MKDRIRVASGAIDDIRPSLPAHPVQLSGQFSAPGNPSPNRGLPPNEFVNDSDISRLYPYSAYMTRGVVAVNSRIRNLALQAFVKAGGVVA